MDINDIVKLIQTVSDYSLTSFDMKDGDFKISITKEPDIQNIPVQAVNAQPIATIVQEHVKQNIEAQDINTGSVVVSPLVGTFYSSSSPDAEPFVKEGDTVKKGQVLGIIEAMKLMNEIECEYDGVVEAVLVKNEEVVEYGQPLFRIR